MAATLNDLPFELQERIHFMKHQLEMKDVCDELLTRPTYTYKGRVFNMRDNYHTCVSGRWCLQYHGFIPFQDLSGQRQVYVDYEHWFPSDDDKRSDEDSDDESS